MRVRRFLAGFYFEREAYADPHRDLAALYEEIASRVTFVDYEGHGASWAADIHDTTQPLAVDAYVRDEAGLTPPASSSAPRRSP